MIARERKRIKLVEKFQAKRQKVKEKISNASSFQEQLDIQENLQKLPRNSSKTRLRNRCWLTGRSRGVYRDFGLSRHVLREMSHDCLLPGVKKSSW